MNNINNYNSIVSKGKILSITAVLFVAIGIIFSQPAFVMAWGYSDYGNSSYSSPASSDWGYSDYGSYSDTSDWGYSDYGSYSDTSDWGYSDYGSYSDASNWGYSDYGSYSDYSDWGYSDYGSYDDYGYSDYGCYGSSCDGGYGDYDYSDYGCYGSSCDGGYQDYGYGGSQGGSQGGSRGGSGGGMSALGLNLNYSDNDTTITDNSDNSVRITETTNTCSNVGNASSSVNNVNCSTTNHVAASDDDDDLEVICRVSDTSIDEGDTVTYEVRITGGRSSYRIEWDGDISGDDEEERVRYNRSGTYKVSVEVRDSNGDRASDDCNDVRVRGEDDDDDDNRITVTTGTNLGTPTGNLSSLESVFLSQVPYTGPGDIARALGILALVAVWSTVVALYLKKQRGVKVVSSKIANFKEQNKNASKIA